MRRHLALTIVAVALLISWAWAQPVTVNPMTKGQLDRLMGWVASGPRTVEVCATCKYTTLNAACAANTSTAASPITFHVHAGTYAAADTMCSGQDHVSFVGDGIGVTILQGYLGSGSGHGFGSDYTHTDCTAFPQACKGALNLGTSTNVEVSGMTLYGSRGIWWAANATGGGNVFIHDVELKGTLTTNGDEDGFFIDSPASGSRFIFANNIVTTNSDGITFDNILDSTTSVYSIGNQFLTLGVTTLTTQNASWALRAVPCLFSSTGDMFRVIGRKPVISDGFATFAYQFDANPRSSTCFGGGASPCTCPSGGVATINGASAYIEATGTSGGAQARGVYVNNLATGLATINVNASNFQSVSDDAAGGTAYGADLRNSTTVFNINGGYFRASGGAAATTKDIACQGGTTLNIHPSVNYTSRTGNETITALTQLNVTTDSGGLTLSATEPNSGMLFLKNTDGSNNEGSPYIHLQSSAASPENNYIQTDASGDFYVFDGSFNPIFRLRASSAGDLLYADTFINKTGATLVIGDGGASNSNKITFNAGTTDASVTWNDTGNGGGDTGKRMEFSSVEQLRIAGKASAPATCSIGDVYIDTTAGSVAWCLCTAANTWTAVGGTGTCS